MLSIFYLLIVAYLFQRIFLLVFLLSVESEGLSMFNMDEKSNGITWISNIYEKMEVKIQKLETGCVKVLKFCAEVVDDLLLPDASDNEGAVSDMSLMHDVDVGICDKSEAGSAIELDHFVSLRRCSSAPTLSHGPYNMNQGQAYGALMEKSNPILNEVTGCNDLEKKGEIDNGHSDLCFAVSSAHSCGSLPVAAVIVRSNDLEQEEAFVSSTEEAEEEFENLKLENCMDPEAEKNKVYFISSQERNKRLNKKKLHDVSSSKMAFTENEDQEKLEIQSINASVETKNYEEISTSSATILTEDKTSNKLLTQETCESDWVLL